MPTVTSRQNPIVEKYRRAARSDDRTLMLLDGVHLVGEALAAGVALVDVAVALGAEARPEVAGLMKQLSRARVPFVGASATVMAALSPVRSASPIVALAARPSGDLARVYDDGARGLSRAAAALVVIVADVQDPGNLGAIVRVAEAAGATGVVAAGACADPFGWKALRGSMGSALRLPIQIAAEATRAIADARAHGCRVIAMAPRGGRSLFDADYTQPTAVLIGGEGPGLPAAATDAADERVTIPMQPPVESLNAAVTAALVLYEALRQRTHETHKNTKTTKAKP